MDLHAYLPVLPAVIALPGAILAFLQVSLQFQRHKLQVHTDAAGRYLNVEIQFETQGKKQPDIVQITINDNNSLIVGDQNGRSSKIRCFMKRDNGKLNTYRTKIKLVSSIEGDRKPPKSGKFTLTIFAAGHQLIFRKRICYPA